MSELVRAQRKQRMTKAQVKEFLYWCFDDVRYNELINWSSGKIVQEYKKDKGIDVSAQFVNLQRRTWMYQDGKLVKIT